MIKYSKPLFRHVHAFLIFLCKCMLFFWVQVHVIIFFVHVHVIYFFWPCMQLFFCASACDFFWQEVNSRLFFVRPPKGVLAKGLVRGCLASPPPTRLLPIQAWGRVRASQPSAGPPPADGVRTSQGMNYTSPKIMYLRDRWVVRSPPHNLSQNGGGRPLPTATLSKNHDTLPYELRFTFEWRF